MAAFKIFYVGERSYNMGDRNQEIRIADNNGSANGGVKLSKREAARQQQKKEQRKKLITTIASVVIVIAILAGVVAVALSKNPNQEKILAGESKYYDIDNAMMAYLVSDYVNQNYFYWVYYYGYSFNPYVSMKLQSFSSTQTWFEYLVRNAMSQVETMVALASASKEDESFQTFWTENNLQEKMDEQLEASSHDLKHAAKDAGYGNINKYLSDTNMTGITKAAVERCWELQIVANYYYSYLLETFTYSDEEIEKYLEENPEKFYKYDYIYYEFPAVTEAGKDPTTEALDSAKAEAEELLGKVSDAEGFKDLIVEMDKAKETTAAGTTSPDTVAPETEAPETEAPATEAEGTEADGTEAETTDPNEKYYKDNVKEEAAYDPDSKFGKWAFEEERKEGDKVILEITKTKMVDGKETEVVTGYAVYYLVKPTYLLEDLTKDVRHILFTEGEYGSKEAAKAKAEEVLALYNAGDKTAEAFGKLAKEYTEDSNFYKGGLYEDVVEGSMTDEFDAWLFDEKRKAGDVEIVETKSYGYHIMYFVGDGLPQWKADVTSSLKSEEYEEKLKDLKKTFAVTFDSTNLDKIPDKMNQPAA